MPVLILPTSQIAKFPQYNKSFDDMPLKDRVEAFAEHHKLDAKKIGEWSDYPLRDWIASTDHVPSWVYFTRFLGPVGKILALKVGCLAARRAVVFWEKEGGGRGEPREVIEYVEELVEKYEASVKNGGHGSKDSVTMRSLRSSAYNLAKYVENHVAWPMSIPAVARAGASVIEHLGVAAGQDDDNYCCLAEKVMGAIIAATNIYEPAYVQTGLLTYSQPKSSKHDQYKLEEQARQRADFLAVLDEIEDMTNSKAERANP